MTEKPCPNAEGHTLAPTSLLAWLEWAEEKNETHCQVVCTGCGLWKVWVPMHKECHS